ncbi:MAG: SUMF1/EgtB/PvdO family nonheme iron enzyme [bacterium]|nr:SUMF1/EgtB/PvdO family nonheme iron enzyme [bacterium]
MSRRRTNLLLPVFHIVSAAMLVTPAAHGEESMPDPTANTINMHFAFIRAGEFAMGQADGDWDERPVHTVRISGPFAMSVTEVTNAQYEQFDPSHKELRGKGLVSTEDDDAAVFVSWHDAVAFCEWLSEKEGKPYRLPTEAEWEYACRAGTTTSYWTGDTLPEAFHKHQKTEWTPVEVSLKTGETPPNPWGLRDMHGNVEEWCADWYGPYEDADQKDPVGRVSSEFRVTRGGSHSTEVEFLRSANRSSAIPEDKHWFIGFRVVIGDAPETAFLPEPSAAPWARDVQQERFDWSGGPEADVPFFEGPTRYVHIPPNMNGPMYSGHNHCPALAACPNGDLLTIWYSTNTEPGRELCIVASRLRRGETEWAPAAPFWDTADRNDHASALLWDGEDTLFFFNGVSTDATWGKLALIMRTSTDNGATWSKTRIINPEHGLRNMPIAGVIMTKRGDIVLPCDAVTGGDGGSAIHISSDKGLTWHEPGAGKPAPEFRAGGTGASIAGIHTGVVDREDGSLLAFGRGDAIDKHLAQSHSTDMGKTWTYSASEFPPIGGGQRLVLRRLQEGPLFFASFSRRLTVTDKAGSERKVKGLFAALSFDNGKTWPVKKLITDGQPAREMNGGGNTRAFTMGPDEGEPRGYMAMTQTPDGVIHLISSALHYRFNVAWLKEPMPAAAP